MTDYKKYINALRKCAKEHEGERTSTGQVIVSNLCQAIAELLEGLEQKPCETQMIDKSNFGQEQYKADLQSAYDCGRASVKPCEDAISRADAVKVASGYCHPSNIAEELAKLPPVTPTQRWIPVSERLPEDFQRVLITIVNYNGDKVVRVAEFHIHSWNKIFLVKENYEQWEVGERGLLAWKPLPEPYDPQESENKE